MNLLPAIGIGFTMKTNTEKASVFFDEVTGNIPYVFVGVKSKHRETAGGVLMSCAA